MNRYIEQLIEDLDHAIACHIEIRSHLDILGESEVCETEEDIPSEEKTAPLSKIIGFDKCCFPPADQQQTIKSRWFIHIYFVF